MGQDSPTNYRHLSGSIKKLKIAIFYDWLNQWGGAERLLLDLINCYPSADIFTTIYDQNQTVWLPSATKITSSFLNFLPLSKSHHRLYSLFQPMAIENLDFSAYDIVISLTSFAGKSIITQPHTLHICYCLTPNRHIYGHDIFKFYRPIDYVYAQRPDYYLTTSQTVQQRITKYFKRNSTVIYPGVDTKKFTPNQNKIEKYFLVVSRLVSYKKIDVAIRACQKLNQNLIIVGSGRQSQYLKSISTPNTQFLGSVSEEKLISLYQNCLALICPQEEDFGLTSLEVQACGRPVIAYDGGGIAETVVHNQTGILYSDQTISSLANALIKFSSLSFDPQKCRLQAMKFSQDQFMLNFKKTVSQLWQNHQRTNPVTTLL